MAYEYGSDGPRNVYGRRLGRAEPRKPGKPGHLTDTELEGLLGWIKYGGFWQEFIPPLSSFPEWARDAVYKGDTRGNTERYKLFAIMVNGGVPPEVAAEFLQVHCAFKQGNGWRVVKTRHQKVYTHTKQMLEQYERDPDFTKRGRWFNLVDGRVYEGP